MTFFIINPLKAVLYLSVTNFHRLFKGATPHFFAIIMQHLQELLTIMVFDKLFSSSTPFPYESVALSTQGSFQDFAQEGANKYITVNFKGGKHKSKGGGGISLLS